MAKKLEVKKDVSVRNKKAKFEYHLIDKYTAGIVLKGSEIKGIRTGKVSLVDSFCLFIGDELWIRNLHISPYEMGSFYNHEAKADRKLLLNKRELRKLEAGSKDTGVTIIPYHLFINDRGFAKVQIALAKGKKIYDKRQDIKEKDLKREMSYR
ncbi:SsrA-binding protein SmpB [Chondrinema litorale]|uniref:SsrA-binding protein SmpB n=1 Tax=Chondrinema litorale TaxID=2994555 RepID=UPI0025440059|nr:SsrA-binding protein SmpB [Chondrinema litorale]UZR94488.1 SsrA-binding protein SmpB [Chondrinema litorale]